MLSGGTALWDSNPNAPRSGTGGWSSKQQAPWPSDNGSSTGSNNNTWNQPSPGMMNSNGWGDDGQISGGNQWNSGAGSRKSSQPWDDVPNGGDYRRPFVSSPLPISNTTLPHRPYKAGLVW